MAREQLKTLTEPMYYILLSLKETRYGYEIMKFISEFTKERVEVGAGTLYALLGRFEDENIIERVSKTGKRKNYIITDYGLEILEEEIQRLLILVEDGNRILKDMTILEEKQEIVEEKKSQDKIKSIFKRADEDILF